MSTAGIRIHEHTQAASATTWTINHNLGHPPVVDVAVNYNGALTKAIPLSVVHTSANQLTVTFSSAKSGIARLA